jgi:hypothetical protein
MLKSSIKKFRSLSVTLPAGYRAGQNVVDGLGLELESLILIIRFSNPFLQNHENSKIV